MSWLLFLDESGHDHRTTPYEVRGGVALDAAQLWPFVQGWRRLELSAFGAELAEYRKELKGAKLLDKDRFKWAAQAEVMADDSRQKYCRRFLTRGLENKPPRRDEFTAYGQACLHMAQGIFQLLKDHGAAVFASAIPRNVARPVTYDGREFLRKDHVFLLERFFYFLEGKQEHGLLVMDEVDKTEDRRFVRRLESYFMRTETGRHRTQWIVPVPFFVASDMARAIQAADLCIYCVNWGFRQAAGMDAPVRREIADEFAPCLQQLQFSGEGYRDGEVFRTYGIVYIPDPYTAR